MELIFLDLSPMFTKSELLRDASDKLCEQAQIERAKAERVRATAIEARELSQRQLLRTRASNVFPQKQIPHTRMFSSIHSRAMFWPRSSNKY